MVLLKEVKEVKPTVWGKLFQTLTIRRLKNYERQLVEHFPRFVVELLCNMVYNKSKVWDNSTTCYTSPYKVKGRQKSTAPRHCDMFTYCAAFCTFYCPSSQQQIQL